MPGTSPVILILGAGPNIGQAVAKTFASKGFKVALAARSLREADSTENQLNITSDFSKPDDVVHAFTKVKQAMGIPSVVIYNGKPWPRMQQDTTKGPQSVPRRLPPRMIRLPSLWPLSIETWLSTLPVLLLQLNRPLLALHSFLLLPQGHSSILGISSTSLYSRHSLTRELASQLALT